MEGLLIDTVCNAFEKYCFHTPNSTVEVDSSNPEYITYAERFKIYLGRDENGSEAYSKWLELSCKASKTHPSIWGTVTIQYCDVDEFAALKLANSISQDNACAVTVNSKGQFQVKSYISLWGFFVEEERLDENEEPIDYRSVQWDSILNSFAVLFGAAAELHLQAASNIVDIQEDF